jgi:hypothetical protein
MQPHWALPLVSALLYVVELRGLEPLTFSLRRPDTRANKLLRRLLVGAWRGAESVSVRVGGTPGVRGTTASMPSTAGLLARREPSVGTVHERPHTPTRVNRLVSRLVNSTDPDIGLGSRGCLQAPARSQPWSGHESRPICVLAESDPDPTLASSFLQLRPRQTLHVPGKGLNSSPSGARPTSAETTGVSAPPGWRTPRPFQAWPPEC